MKMKLISRTPPPPGMVYRKVGEKVELDGGEYVVKGVTESSATVRMTAAKHVKARSSRVVHISPVRERRG